MYESNVEVFKKSFEGWQTKALYAIGEFVEGEAKLRCPVGQYEGQTGGNLRGSIGHKVYESQKMVRIGSPVEYAAAVEKGSVPHLILPKPGNKVLTWIGSSGRIFTTHVHHPGTKAQPFLTPAVEENTAKIGQIISKIQVAPNG